MPAYHNILAITANPELGRMLSLGLPLFGFSARVVAPEAGLSVVREWTPNAVLLDIPWNAHQAFALCEELRGLPAMAEVPILCVTTDIRPARWVDVLVHGGDDLVLLPAAFQVLAERIRFHLAQVRYRAQTRELVPAA